MDSFQVARQIIKYAGVDTRSPLCTKEEFREAIALLYDYYNPKEKKEEEQCQSKD